MNGYRDFMMDYMKEYRANEMQYGSFEEDVDDLEYDEAAAKTSKEGVYKENYYMRDHIQIPFVSSILKTTKGRDRVIDFLGRFIDKHAQQLSTSGPVYSFTFSEKEAAVLYEIFNITKEQLISFYEEMINETYYGNISKFFIGWVKNAPHKILITAMLIDAIQNGYEDIVTCCEYMYAFTEYAILYRNFWKTGVKEDVMNYTIEHLGNKFKIKKMKNLKELLKYDANKSVQTWYNELQKGVDNVYNDLMYRMRSQFNSTLKNISREYYKNSENNATQHNNVSTFDDGQIANQEGHTSNSMQIIDNTVEKFANKEINPTLLRIAANGAKVDKGNLSGYISTIYADPTNKINKFIEDVITLYFTKYPENSSLQSKEFLNMALKLFKTIGSSKDEICIELKDIVNHWANDIINIYNDYDREATWSAYKSALFTYFTLLINYYNN